MRARLQRYVNEHSATYIVLLSACEVVDVNGSNAFPYVHFNSKWRVDCKEVRCCCTYDNQTLKISIFCSYYLNWITRRICSVRRPSAAGCSKCLTFCSRDMTFCVKVSNIATNFVVKRCKYKYWIAFCRFSRVIWIASERRAIFSCTANALHLICSSFRCNSYGPWHRQNAIQCLNNKPHTVAHTFHTVWFAKAGLTYAFTTYCITWFCIICVARACFVTPFSKWSRSASCNFSQQNSYSYQKYQIRFESKIIAAFKLG